MSEPIISRDRITHEARAAAFKYDDVNHACPYSFYTDAGKLFKAEFTRARAELAASGNSTITQKAEA